MEKITNEKLDNMQFALSNFVCDVIIHTKHPHIDRYSLDGLFNPKHPNYQMVMKDFDLLSELEAYLRYGWIELKVKGSEFDETINPTMPGETSALRHALLEIEHYKKALDKACLELECNWDGYHPDRAYMMHWKMDEWKEWCMSDGND